MKYILYLFCFLMFHSLLHAQKLMRMVDSYTGDSTISTGFDTLNTQNKSGVPDRVVGVRTVHKKQNKYWLFFYFSTADITSHSVSISKKNYAYFVRPNNEYLRLSYTGKSSSYSDKDNAGFFIDITDYVSRLQTVKFKVIRFETSQLYHEIQLSETKQTAIATIVNSLVE